MSFFGMGSRMSNYKRIPPEELVKGEIYLGYHKYEGELYYLKYLGIHGSEHTWSCGSYTAFPVQSYNDPYECNCDAIIPIQRIPKTQIENVKRSNSIYYEEFDGHLPPELLYGNFRLINVPSKTTPMVS